ncbi:MAG: UvrD-helicase domain-containing protein [Bacteroidales bacterium]
MLKIYKASAGSGKTYNLTLEFLRLLFKQRENYKHTLAVTFTNKATEEMKSRIITDLYKLASGQPSGYLELLSQEFDLSEKFVRIRAREILTQILHDYSSFNISTIDKFFQQTMRSFTREIGLQGGYNVELDQNRVLSESIDKMLLSLSKKENKELLQWLLEYSESMVEEGDSWDFTKKIKELAAEILKEEYIRKREGKDESLLSKDAIKSYIEKMRKIRRNFEDHIKGAGQKGLQLMEQYGVTSDDFPKYGVYDQFIKWKNGNPDPYSKALVAIENPDKWTKSKPKADVMERVSAFRDSGGGQLLAETMAYTQENKADYITACLIQKNIFTQGILSDIAEKIQEYKKENNIMLISDTTQLLNRIIDGSDTPFIYEKIGTRINNYMIDEFQDTSGMQWRNFSPLLHESQSSDYFNMIVGDVKQSIYRWRSSDWSLLDSKLYEEFDESQRRDEVLKVNYRSRPNIIHFNNAFFVLASRRLQQIFDDEVAQSTCNTNEPEFQNRIMNAYVDIYQQISERKQSENGRVHIEFIEEDEENKWKDIAVRRTIEEIKNLQERGYELRDIAVLVRANSEAVSIANALLEEKLSQTDDRFKFDIISNEALLIANSSAIKLILSIMRYFCNPLETLNRSLVATEYSIIHSGRGASEAITEYFSRMITDENQDKLFSDELDSLLKEIGRKPLYEMTEQIIASFLPKENGNEKIFIQAFLDIILDFTHKQTSDLAAFLEWWDEFGYKKTVSTPSSQNAIQIITVHKSKGLAFPVVIMPFCHWDLAPRRPILWCTPSKEPFSDIPVVPIMYKKDLANTIFAEDYLRERMQTLIDNLNVAYVAFTRPEEEMILFAPKGKESKNADALSQMGKLMLDILSNASALSDDQGRAYINFQNYFDSELSTLTLGEESTINHTAETKDEDVSSSSFISYDPYFNNRIKLRFYADEFFNEGDERRSGKIKHDILSRVFTPDDLEKSVRHAVLSGTASKEEGEEYRDELKRIILNPKVHDWFSGKHEVMNEIALLLPGGEMLRPDRILRNDDEIIVIDYKFGKEQKKYIKQVKAYVKHIADMGYPNVKGYLWYVMSDKIEEVTI